MLKFPTRQLCALAACRFAQNFAFVSIFPYLPDYLQALGIKEDEVATCFGALAATFNICEFCVVLPLTKLSDRYGRKKVLLGAVLLQLFANCSLGFCSSIYQVFLCVVLIGAANGNIALLRSLVADLVTKDMQSKAFSFLPTATALATILGPMVGGELAKLEQKDPMIPDYPYALPNMVTAVLFLPGIIAVTQWVKDPVLSTKSVLHSAEEGIALDEPTEGRYKPLSQKDIDDDEEELIRPKGTWLSAIYNPYIWLNSLIGLHAGTFDQLVPVFLERPVTPPSSWISFTTGLGKDSEFVGLLLTVAGIVGILTAVVGFPRAVKRFGDTTALKYALISFIPIYVAFPFTALIGNSIVQILVLGVLVLIKIGMSVVAAQSCLILLTNAAGGNVSNAHGVNFSIASISRGIGSVTTGLLFSLGVKLDFVILPYLILGAWALITLLVHIRVH